MKRLPRFCNKCGKELIKSQTVNSYDIYTGEVVKAIVTLRCPDYSSTIRGTNGHFYTTMPIDKESTE